VGDSPITTSGKLAMKVWLLFHGQNDFKLAFKFLCDPFHFDITYSNKEIATLLSLDKQGFENDLIALHSMEHLKVRQISLVTEMWKYIPTGKDL
jgi:hypothetical protein